MNIYKCYDSGGIEELGFYNEKELPRLISQAVESLGNNDFGIGVNRTEKDFVEIRPVGNNQFMLWSDRLNKSGSFLSKIFQSRNIQLTLKGEDEAIEAIKHYVMSSRERFEEKYS
jgi:hypothetical protein